MRRCAAVRLSCLMLLYSVRLVRPSCILSVCLFACTFVACEFVVRRPRLDFDLVMSGIFTLLVVPTFGAGVKRSLCVRNDLQQSVGFYVVW